MAPAALATNLSSCCLPVPMPFDPLPHVLSPLRRIKAQRLASGDRPATEVVELGAGPTPDAAYKVGWHSLLLCPPRPMELAPAHHGHLLPGLAFGFSLVKPGQSL